MQIIVEVGIDPASYVNEQYQRRVRAPLVCPNCGSVQVLDAHNYGLPTLPVLGMPNLGRLYVSRTHV
jgi:hypothetical protein